MPLLMCPNDNAAMQTLERGGVQFDMCPSCRGVWLDRGELEKLMDSAMQDGRASAPQAAPAPQAQPASLSRRAASSGRVGGRLSRRGSRCRSSCGRRSGAAGTRGRP